MATVGQKIRELRMERGWTQERLAFECLRVSEDGRGISTDTVKNVENNHHRVSPHVLLKIARALEADFDTLQKMAERVA